MEQHVSIFIAYQVQMEQVGLDGASETIQSKIQGVILTPLLSHSKSNPLGTTFILINMLPLLTPSTDWAKTTVASCSDYCNSVPAVFLLSPFSPTAVFSPQSSQRDPLKM